MKTLFLTGTLRTFNLNTFSINVPNHRNLYSTFSTENFSDCYIIGFFHLKKLKDPSLPIKNYYIMSTITNLPNYIDEKFKDLIISNNHNLHLFYLIEPEATNSYINFEFKKKYLNYTLPEFILIITSMLKKGNTNNLENINNRSIFLIKYPWYEVVEAFKNENIFFYGGDATKRHILTPYQRRLSFICDELGISLDFTSKCYNSNSYLFNKGLKK